MTKSLSQALQDEYNAIHFYEQLAKLAPTEEAKTRILAIRQDEMRHYTHLTHWFTCLTGQVPSLHVTVTFPSDFASGIREAFHDEQGAVSFYQQAAHNTSFPPLSQQFRSHAIDEQTHAVWFLYLMQQV